MLGVSVLRVCALAALVASATAQARAETLTDALIAAYRHSGLLEQNRALVRAADEDVAQAVAALRPVLNYVASYDYSEGPSPVTGRRVEDDSASLALSAEMLLYDFGATRYAIDAAKEAVLAAREALTGVEQDVLFRAVQAYMNVRRAAAFVALGESNVRVITQELRAARDRFEVGEVTRTDVSIAEARLAASRASLASAVGDLAQAREEYRTAVGQYPGDLAPPPPEPDIVGSVEAALAIARREHPAINEAQREVTVAELNVQRAKAAMYPSLNATARLDFDLEDNFEDQRRFGLSLSGPIYQGGRLSSIYRQAQARRDAARSALYTVVFQVEQAVGNAWAVLNVAGASIQANEEQVDAAGVAFEGFQQEATLGARTTLDVLDAEQELLDARASLISAQIDEYIAVYALLQAIGMLTAEDLNLGIVTYDPADYYNSVQDAPVREVSPQGEKLDRVLRKLLR